MMFEIGPLVALAGLAALGSIYSYAIYPGLLWVLVRVGKRTSESYSDAFTPTVSLVIAAHNEELRITDKLRNSVEIDYPGLEIVVASDASSDGTDRLLKQFADSTSRSVELARSPERRGKEAAQALGIEKATGDILVFSDVGTRIPEGAIHRMVRYFSNPEVGAVSSKDRFVTREGALAGEGLYIRYEMGVRRLESHVAGLVGLSGSFFGARREICLSWDTDSPSDLVTALNCARSGKRAVLAQDVHGFYTDLADPAKEYRRKVRTILRGMTGLARHRDALSPRQGLFAWQLWSHKIMRWASPYFMLAFFLISVPLALERPGWRWVLGAQAVGGGAILMAHAIPRLRRVTVLRVGYYFALANVAILTASWLLLRGQRITSWSPSRRSVA